MLRQRKFPVTLTFLTNIIFSMRMFRCILFLPIRFSHGAEVRRTNKSASPCLLLYLSMRLQITLRSGWKQRTPCDKSRPACCDWQVPRRHHLRWSRQGASQAQWSSCGVPLCTFTGPRELRAAGDALTTASSDSPAKSLKSCRTSRKQMVNSSRKRLKTDAILMTT